MKKMKNVLLMVGLMILLSTQMVFANGSKEQSTSGSVKKIKIGATVYGLTGEYMKLWATALERHPEVLNGNVDLTIFDGKYDASVQLNQFETMATQGFDAIIFVPIDIEAGAAAVEVAAKSNIPVIGSNTRVNSDKLYSYIGSNDVESGYMEAEAVINAMGGSGNVVIIEGPIGQSAQIERREGNLKSIAEHSGVTVLEMKTANWSRAEAMSLMENWLSAHPGEINGVIGQNDEMALGAIQAIKDAGLDISNFPTAGIDGVTDALTGVKNDEMVKCILQDATGQAQGAMDLALRAIEGESYKPQAACWDSMEWGSKVELKYNVPWVPITLENVDGLLTERAKLTAR